MAMTIRLTILAGLSLLAAGGPVLAQERGGLALDPAIGDGPKGLAQPLPFTRNPYVTARDLQGSTAAADHQAKNQAMITKLRGDPGYLAGFSSGTPLAASRQQVEMGGFPDDGGYRYRRRHGHGDSLIIVNEGNGPITIGNDNVVQQQTAITSGPVAQQQVSTMGSSGGGALNSVGRSGNIVQRSPNGQ
jgi:hypothetical protein